LQIIRYSERHCKCRSAVRAEHYAQQGIYNFDIVSRHDTINYRILVTDCIENSFTNSQQNINTTINPLTDNNSDFRIYPNPASDYIMIETHGSVGNFECQISDITGKLLFKANLKGFKNEINTSSYSKGSYVITLSSSESIFHQKIIIQ